MISEKKVITSVAVTNYAFRDQIIDWNEEALTRKHCAIHLFAIIKRALWAGFGPRDVVW